MLNLIEKYNELTKSELEELAEITLLAIESLINTIVEEGKQIGKICTYKVLK